MTLRIDMHSPPKKDKIMNSDQRMAIFITAIICMTVLGIFAVTFYLVYGHKVCP